MLPFIMNEAPQRRYGLSGPFMMLRQKSNVSQGFSSLSSRSISQGVKKLKSPFGVDSNFRMDSMASRVSRRLYTLASGRGISRRHASITRPAIPATIGQAIKRATIEEKQPKERKKKWSHHTNLLLSLIHRIKQSSVTRTLPRQSNFSQNTSYKAKQACIAIAE
jgi:hypothetical protein